MNKQLESLLNEVSEIKNALNDIRSLLMNTKAKGNAQKPLKTAINDSLSLNATNKTTITSSNNIFDFSKIEYCEGSKITTKDLYEAISTISLPLNVFSREFKHTTFYKEHSIIPYRSLKSRGFRNIRLRLDTSNQQS